MLAYHVTCFVISCLTESHIPRWEPFQVATLASTDLHRSQGLCCQSAQRNILTINIPIVPWALHQLRYSLGPTAHTTERSRAFTAPHRPVQGSSIMNSLSPTLKTLSVLYDEKVSTFLFFFSFLSPCDIAFCICFGGVLRVRGKDEGMRGREGSGISEIFGRWRRVWDIEKRYGEWRDSRDGGDACHGYLQCCTEAMSNEGTRNAF